VVDARWLTAETRRLARFHRLVRVVRAALLASLGDAEDSLAASIHIPPEARSWAAIDPGFQSCAPLARLDTWAEGPIPRYLELNAEAPAGMGYLEVLSAQFVREPAAAGLLAFDPVGALRATLGGIWRERQLRVGRRGLPRAMAIVDFAGGGTAPELRYLARRLSRRFPCVVADPRELTFDGETLRAGDVPIDLVYRRALVRDLRERRGEATAFLAAYGAGRVCVVNPLRTALLHNKGIFALLRDPRIPLTPGDQAFVERHVPHSYVLPGHPSDPDRVRRGREDAVAAAHRSPEEWVIKPLEDHGGRGVFLDAAGIRAGLEVQAPRLLQRRIRPATAEFVDVAGERRTQAYGLDPFLARGRLCGVLCRVLHGVLGNVTSGGASMVPVLMEA
jgi:hypothetical protein